MIGVVKPIRLPQGDGSVLDHVPAAPRAWARPSAPAVCRVAFAAAHVAADPLADNTPGAPARGDWDSTLNFRRHLWSWGLAVAEAMDTAQRGMGLDWPTTQELIRRSAAEARACGGRIAAGAGTDHLPATLAGLDDVVAGYEQQVAVVEDAGAQVILMASRQLAALAATPHQYQAVYRRVLSQVADPVILHWLGPMFDPALAGYWGSRDPSIAMTSLLELIGEHADVVDGVKVSVLDPQQEVRLRSELPPGVRLYTGDDLNYLELIRGDGSHASDALLGVFAAIAPAASAALQALDAGDGAAYDDALRATLPLSRHLFGPPTYYYKTGIAFLAWLAGHQPGFTMVAGLQSARSAVHLAEAYRLADLAGLFPDPDLTTNRLRAYLQVAGVGE